MPEVERGEASGRDKDYICPKCGQGGVPYFARTAGPKTVTVGLRCWSCGHTWEATRQSRDPFDWLPPEPR
jgi:DNA-directed RNA polymerase subunit M/transcription elongation factor TFIIS